LYFVAEIRIIAIQLNNLFYFLYFIAHYAKVVLKASLTACVTADDLVPSMLYHISVYAFSTTAPFRLL